MTETAAPRGARRGSTKTASGAHDDSNGGARSLSGEKSLLHALAALADGDFSARLTDAAGASAPLTAAFNLLAGRLDLLSSRLVELSKVVGRDGDMTARVDVAGLHAGWSTIGESFNSLVGDLARPSTEVARVLAAVAAGDLSQQMPLEIDGKPVRGEFLRIGTTVNTLVDQLNTLGKEVTRVAREVGTEGKLGGQAQVHGVAGTWKDLTESVNGMAYNLTTQVRGIAAVVTAVATGDLSKKLVLDAQGEILELKNTVNTMVDQLNSFASEVTRVAREVGTEGKLGGQAKVPGVAGTWKDLTDNVNSMASNLTVQLRDVSKVATAIANGDLTQKVVVDVQGEILQIKNVINQMVGSLNTFASEVTRVAREVGTDGKLGGQAHVPGVAGTWKDLTDSVNSMASNLTTQVRGIVKVVTAVANGDLSQNFSMEAQGEIAALADTINTMTKTLRIFADQVISVAREVGTEGKLGGQAKVPGVSGTWRDLTDNVNQLANNLTTQVRAMSEVATAVTDGDLTRSITVEAQGELLALKERVNQMISNLRDTTQKNREQDWLKTNLAKFGAMMQGQKSLESVSRMIMSELTPLVEASHAGFFVMNDGDETLRLLATYACSERKALSNRFGMGEGLVGQCALEKKSILLTNVPPDYIQIGSGLGAAPPRNILVVPCLFEGDVRAVIELASFQQFSSVHRIFLEQLSASIGVVLNVIAANTRTERLLNQSQSLAQELQQQQEELKRSNAELAQQARSLKQSEEMLKEQQDELRHVNEELEDKAKLLVDQKLAVEQKNREVELARAALEEKAEQLAVSARYKSEFLANMSHELRTPLNSLLILARLLADNREGNLNDKQIEYARTIHAAGSDLVNLINEVLDLSKIEAGKIDIDSSPVELSDVLAYAERNFRALAQQKNVDFRVVIDPDVPPIVETDAQRLQQVLRNLIGNAFKFTDSGHVEVRASRASREIAFEGAELVARPDRVLAISVCDTGTGIPPEKHELIFEAFQQADGTTSRRYGGTGLGLTISRELTRLLGGEIRVESGEGTGSTFSVYLPMRIDVSAPAPDASTRSSPGASSAPAESARVPLRAEAPLTSASGEDALHDPRLVGRTVLVVDDDIRNIFALTTLLEQSEVHVLFAENGRDALRMLEEHPAIELVLMDIMMPTMDGYETMREVRKRTQFHDLPIIALTAKAMKGDSEKCLEAGASAYVTKPVDPERLFSVLRVWVDVPDAVAE